ncbi:MAG: ABC transporter substrate-binding protein [Elusimicrobiales bacterium]|nr:ABC transporter substrate-binding protein [Elusimicrobiales bacterium]
MKRFIMLTLIIFGFFLSYQTLRIMSQQKYIADVNVNQFKGKTINVISPDIFAEKNIIDTFSNRYKGTVKFNLVKNDKDFISANYKDSDIIIFPSYFYENFISNKILLKIDVSKVPNLDKLMDNHTNLMKEKYTDNGSILAIPTAYIPYGIFFDPQKIKPSTSAKDYFIPNRKIAIPDSYESLIALSRFLNLPFNKNFVKSLSDKVKKENLIIYSLDDLESSLKLFQEKRPDLIIAPVYLKGFFERRGGTIEMILPDEGTYATFYLTSFINERERELSFVFLNHLLDPLIHKNYTNSFSIPITNKVSLNTLPALLYNSLKMNDPTYFEKIYLLKNEEDYKKALDIYKDFKSIL